MMMKNAQVLIELMNGQINIKIKSKQKLESVVSAKSGNRFGSDINGCNRGYRSAGAIKV